MNKSDSTSPMNPYFGFDYDQMFDGSRWELIRGEDYPLGRDPTGTIRTTAYHRGLSISIKRTERGLEVQCHGRIPPREYPSS